jgi:hypothetical protein
LNCGQEESRNKGFRKNLRKETEVTIFKEFIDEALSEGFDKFVTLYYPRPTHLKDATWAELMRERLKAIADAEAGAAHYRRFGEGMDCVDEWLDEVKKSANEEQFRYLKLMEDQTRTQDFAFHILLGGCDWNQFEFNGHWKPLWREISGGGAYERKIDPRIGGLIRHILFNTNCILETNDGKRYRADDFEEWNKAKES